MLFSEVPQISKISIVDPDTGWLVSSLQLPLSETPSPPLGLAFLAGYLAKHEIQVRILDFAVFPQKSDILDNEIKSFRPDIVGTTAVTTNFDTAMQILAEAKRLDPDVVTLSGGPHFTYDAQRSLQTQSNSPVIKVLTTFPSANV